MAFAIFYNPEDLSSIVGNTQGNIRLTQQDKQLVQKCWNGGLKLWTSAPLAQSPCEEVIPTNTARRVVIDAPNVTLQMFRDLLYRIAIQFAAEDPTGEGIQYLRALADDMGGCAGAVEPWP